MKYENLFPIHFALNLQNTNLITWTNKSTTTNTVMCWVDHTWFFLLNQLLKHDLYCLNTWVVDQTAIDNLLNDQFIKNTSRLTLMTTFYSYFSKTRTILLTNTNGRSVFSVDGIFKNCNWLEREISEMYGLHFEFKTDSRKLLLDYSKIEHPMLKDFPSEGVRDVFYDILDNQVTITSNETTEL